MARGVMRLATAPQVKIGIAWSHVPCVVAQHLLTAVFKLANLRFEDME